jgi:ABC-type phosphate transport system permease subunit
VFDVGAASGGSAAGKGCSGMSFAIVALVISIAAITIFTIITVAAVLKIVASLTTKISAMAWSSKPIHRQWSIRPPITGGLASYFVSSISSRPTYVVTAFRNNGIRDDGKATLYPKPSTSSPQL